MAAPQKVLLDISLDEKDSPLWQAAAFIWGYLFLFWILTLATAADLFSLRFYVLFGGGAAFLSIAGVRGWLRGDFNPKEAVPISAVMTDTKEDPGVFNVRIVGGKQRRKMGPKVKETQYSPGQYAFWWAMVRLPMFIGDKLLSSIWGGIDRVLGGGKSSPGSGVSGGGGLPGVEALKGFGGNSESSGILEEAKAKGLIDPEDQDTHNPYIGRF